MQLNGKADTIVGFEPTGHYWFALGYFLESCDYKLGIVNPYHVKFSRELDDNSHTKNDHKDPKTIAMLVKDGRYRDVYIPDDLYQELREAVLERESLFKTMTPMLANNPEFRAMHARNITRSLNPMNKMQSIIALCGKLVRVIYAVLGKGNHYDSGKMLSDMNLQQEAA